MVTTCRKMEQLGAVAREWDQARRLCWRLELTKSRIYARELVAQVATHLAAAGEAYTFPRSDRAIWSVMFFEVPLLDYVADEQEVTCHEVVPIPIICTRGLRAWRVRARAPERSRRGNPVQRKRSK